ncbi:MAG: hypothetical protein WBA76_12840 [Phormidesmis sp.]
MLSGIKRQGVVGKNGMIEIQTSELAEGTVVEVIVLTEQQVSEGSDELLSVQGDVPQDETAYLLSTEANRRQLMRAIQQVEEGSNLVSFTLEEWNEEYSIHS